VSQGLSGFVTSDLPFDRLWPGAGFDPDARGLLHTYTWGRNAQRMMAQSPAERIRATVAEVAKVFPEMPDHFEGGTSKCWEENPWERGALIEFWPGEMATWPAILKRPEGRLHFAPEHTSSWPVWMQGALESGNRVAREIDQEPAPK
jgi:monoamine oxidase